MEHLQKLAEREQKLQSVIFLSQSSECKRVAVAIGNNDSVQCNISCNAPYCFNLGQTVPITVRDHKRYTKIAYLIKLGLRL